MTSRFSILIAVAVPLAGVLAAGCGGSSDGASDTPPEVAAPSSAAAPATAAVDTRPTPSPPSVPVPTPTSETTSTIPVIEPVRVLVTNDDGVSAEGIDMIVQALLGPVIDASGTVGAARAAALRNVPAIAVSAGFGDTVDFESATAALISYLDENLEQILDHDDGAPVTEAISINVPTCVRGEIRGTVVVPLGADLREFDYGSAVDCTSTVENPIDDVDAFFNGFVAVSPTPLQPAGT